MPASQAGRRGFEPRLPLHLFNNLGTLSLTHYSDYSVFFEVPPGTLSFRFNPTRRRSPEQLTGSHVRSYEAGKATTLTEHRPKSHQKYLGRTPSRLIEEAQQTGACTGQLVEAILAAKRHPEQGFRSCLGILRLAKTYPAERMEAAARRCLRARAYNFQSMDSILKNQLDRLPIPGDPSAQTAVDHDNIRGADYFDSPPEADPPVIP